MAVDQFDRLKDPEYTGENRCAACTAVNTLVAAVVGFLVALQWPVAGLGVFVASLALIYFRGYLVPGTPALTKRYFPRWLLEYFHGDRHPDAVFEAEADSDDPYGFLDSIGAIRTCEERDGVCLTPAFRRRWEDRIDRIRSRGVETSIAESERIDADEIAIEEEGEGVSLWLDERKVGYWDSRAVLLADLASWQELAASSTDWRSIPDDTRRQIVGGLRIFVEQCPECAVPITEETETVQGCCSHHTSTRTRGRCPECGASFFEKLTADDLPYDRQRTHGSSVTMTFPLEI